MVVSVKTLIFGVLHDNPTHNCQGSVILVSLRDSPTPRLCVIDAFKIPKPHRCHKCCGPWAHCQNCQKITTYVVGTVKRQNTSSSEPSWRKIAETRQSLFRKSAWSGYAHKMCAVDSNTKRLYSNEMSDRATHFMVFMIMNCPVEQQILAAYGSIVDSRRTFARVSLYLNYSFRKLRMPPKRT